MSKREYLKALNDEIQKLNEIIDTKIMHESNYKRESRRHRMLLRQIRRENRSRSIVNLVRSFSIT